MSSIEEITEKILDFRNARKWKKYHTPKNLALSLIVEIGELFELIQWQTDSEIKDEIHKIQGSLTDEIADVTIYLFLLAHELNINLNTAILQKIDKNSRKYPVGSLTDEEIKWGKANN